MIIINFNVYNKFNNFIKNEEKMSVSIFIEYRGLITFKV